MSKSRGQSRAQLEDERIARILCEFNDELRTTGDIDIPTLLAKYPSELHREIRGLANTALLTKRALQF